MQKNLNWHLFAMPNVYTHLPFVVWGEEGGGGERLCVPSSFATVIWYSTRWRSYPTWVIFLCNLSILLYLMNWFIGLSKSHSACSRHSSNQRWPIGKWKCESHGGVCGFFILIFIRAVWHASRRASGKDIHNLFFPLKCVRVWNLRRVYTYKYFVYAIAWQTFGHQF